MSQTRDRIQKLIDERESELAELKRDAAALDGGEEELGPPITPLNDFVAEGLLDNDDDTWLIRSQIPRGGMGFLAADPGLGKTTLLVQISLLLAAGRPVFGYHTRQARTLLVAAEGARKALSARVHRAANTLNVATSTPTWFVQSERIRNFFIRGGDFEAMLEASRPDLVILDTLKFFWQGDENNADSFTANVSRPLKELGAKYGSTFWMVHHHRKAQVGEEGGPHQGRGTSIMFADADFWWRLKRADGGLPDARTLLCDKNKYGPAFPPLALTFNAGDAVLETE